MADEQGSSDQAAKVSIAKIITTGEVIARVVHSISKFGVFGLLIYFGFRSIEVLAVNLNGKVTLADIRFQAILDWASDPDTSCTLFGVLAVAGIIYGRMQSKLRKDVVERLHPYQKKYEELQDSNRSSSQLTKRGDTRPEDE